MDSAAAAVAMPPPPPPPPATAPSTWPEFLVFFVHRHFAFRYPELEAVLALQQIRLADAVIPSADATSTADASGPSLPTPEDSPLLRLRLPSAAHAKFLSARGILVKAVYEVWGHTPSDDYTALVRAVDAYAAPTKAALIADEACSWCIRVEAFGRKLTMAEQEARREHFSEVLPFAGPVVVTQPQEKFLILEEYAVELHNVRTLTARVLWFLRELAGSEKNRGRGGARDLIDQQTLKRRAYIGPTSMESEMALLMCNMGLVQHGDLVIDPFVGTGSVLIPCATHGAVCFGTDIDIRVLLGTGVGVSGNGPASTTEDSAASGSEKAKDSAEANDDAKQESATRVNVRTNFEQYGLPLPELIRADNSRSPLVERCREFFDAVVCDPPYGIRAGARKSGRRPGAAVLSTERLEAKAKRSYIPPTQPYAAEDVMRDLLEFAAQTLRDGGRLVYLLPTTYEYTDADLPRHPRLELVANSEQKLTKKYARRLITMIKRQAAVPVAPQTEDQHLVTVDGAATVGQGRSGDVSFANLREKILAENRKRKSGELE